MSKAWSWVPPLAVLAALNVLVGLVRSLQPAQAMDLHTVAAWGGLWLRGVDVYAALPAEVDYPPWAIVFLAPLSWLPAEALRVVWVLLNVAMGGGLVLWLAGAGRVQHRRWLALAVLLTATACLRVLNQFSLLSYTLGLAGAAVASPWAGGVLLGLSLIKPQVGGVVLAWVVLSKKRHGWQRAAIALFAVATLHLVYAVSASVSPLAVAAEYLGGLRTLYELPTELYGHVELRPWLWRLWPDSTGNFLMTAGLGVVLLLPALKAAQTTDASDRDRSLELLALLGAASLLTVRHMSYDFIMLLPALVAWRTLPFSGRSNAPGALFYPLATLVIVAPASWLRAAVAAGVSSNIAVLAEIDRVMSLAVWLVLAWRLNRSAVAGRRHEPDPVPVDEYVQRRIAGTNGNLYRPLVNRLTRSPIARWPVPNARSNGGLLLDIGCGWGRWMVAAARVGYRPVGIDIRLEPAQAARRVMRAHGVKGHVVVADLNALPFRDGTFDAVFSYSVIQHAHRRKGAACIRDVHRVLKDGASCLIELPLKFGLTNVRYLLQPRTDEDALESWAVRYYRWRELRELFLRPFGNVRVKSDCFCGIGVRPEDIDLLPWAYKPIVVVSEMLRICTRIFPPFVRFSDSVFVEATKQP